jgi:hypothetical protein
LVSRAGHNPMVAAYPNCPCIFRGARYDSERTFEYEIVISRRSVEMPRYRVPRSEREEASLNIAARHNRFDASLDKLASVRQLAMISP